MLDTRFGIDPDGKPAMIVGPKLSFVSFVPFAPLGWGGAGRGRLVRDDVTRTARCAADTHALIAPREIRKRPELGPARIRQDPRRPARGGGAEEPECRLARATEDGDSREQRAALKLYKCGGGGGKGTEEGVERLVRGGECTYLGAERRIKAHTWILIGMWMWM
ncbi:hypothetical protein BJY52DRAFT_1264688 [Lactarius psammicola]|nr:hypothetical protein BJY52DRAFT_1264688 [Lactarius psammicola]